MDNKRTAWGCKIGVVGGVEVPPGGDAPMRAAVEKAFFELTGVHAEACFSGWGEEFTQGELAVISPNISQEPPLPLPSADGMVELEGIPGRWFLHDGLSVPEAATGEVNWVVRSELLRGRIYPYWTKQAENLSWVWMGPSTSGYDIVAWRPAEQKP